MRTSLIVILLISLMSCNEEYKEITFINFQFHDSSVPPPYHRSYELVFSESSVRIIVDSYGDTLTDEIVELGKEKVDEILELPLKYKIKNSSKSEEDGGCSGGTGISVSFGKNEEFFCKGYVYFCGGGHYGDLTGDLKAFQKEITSSIPDFSSYLKEG